MATRSGPTSASASAIGDLHQPFHALGVGRGGNDVRVRVFGQTGCGPSTPLKAGNAPARSSPCNLHSVWDSRLIARRNLDDPSFVGVLQEVIANKGFGSQPPGTPQQWAEQSFKLAKEALVTPDTNIDEAYFRRHIAVIEDRLALGGIRLAAVLNKVLTGARRRQYRLLNQARVLLPTGLETFVHVTTRG